MAQVLDLSLNVLIGNVCKKSNRRDQGRNDADAKRDFDTDAHNETIGMHLAARACDRATAMPRLPAAKFLYK